MTGELRKFKLKSVKKKVLVLLLVFLLLSSYVPCIAQTTSEDPFEKAFREYQENLNNYHQTYKEYQAAKEEYFSYQTLTSKTVAFEQMLAMLKIRSLVIASYLNLIRIKLNVAETGNEAIYLQEFDRLRVDLSDEIGFYQQSEKDLSSKNSIEQLLDFSLKIESRYKEETQPLMYKSLLSLFSIREKILTKTIYDQLGIFGEKINLLKGSGANINKLNQWLEDAKNKTSQANKSQSKIEEEIFTRQSLNVGNYENLYKSLLDSFQLLEEVVFYLKEIIGEMKTYPVEFFQTPTPIMPTQEATSAAETATCEACSQKIIK